MPLSKGLETGERRISRRFTRLQTQKLYDGQVSNLNQKPGVGAGRPLTLPDGVLIQELSPRVPSNDPLGLAGVLTLESDKMPAPPDFPASAGHHAAP